MSERSSPSARRRRSRSVVPLPDSHAERGAGSAAIVAQGMNALPHRARRQEAARSTRRSSRSVHQRDRRGPSRCAALAAAENGIMAPGRHDGWAASLPAGRHAGSGARPTGPARRVRESARIDARLGRRLERPSGAADSTARARITSTSENKDVDADRGARSRRPRPPSKPRPAWGE